MEPGFVCFTDGVAGESVDESPLNESVVEGDTTAADDNDDDNDDLNTTDATTAVNQKTPTGRVLKMQSNLLITCLIFLQNINQKNSIACLWKPGP